MDAKEHLKQMVDHLVKGDLEQAKAAHHQYVEQKSRDLLKEDHDYLLTERGIKEFLLTLHKHAKKKGKDEAFLLSLAKYIGKDECTDKDFAHAAAHFAKNKKQADKFIHHVEHKLGLKKDDPAADIRGTPGHDKD